MTTPSSTNAGSPTGEDAPRKQWMAVLAKAPAKRVEALATAYLEGVADAVAPRFRVLRRPETGLVMVRGRAGGTGDPFNMGEMTVTRCTVVLERDGAAAVAGHAYIAGRDRAHATLAAKLDALLQTDGHHGPLMAALVEPLAREAEERRAARRRRVGATKVDFFTLVRGED
ncbi:phosphonate C-P lyase system protein PhnG [Marivibrio halodurans]|uniref:Phosphonate C-P lyase system protein PhnG n=1 Tax=Marivibrio halodurans TaxID=2039722 RepID=A0A8J7SHJ8_9PROT|nr:phosphonate C-P lyase system protein PhnG [Marivibrio halodurans]MBP5856463.1 phosphonate C-P lyase system protein PhnG [Marivibrio halodurans]